MQTIHLRNTQALLNPAVVGIFRQALAAVPYCAPGGFDSCTDNIFSFIRDHDDFVTVAGVEAGQFTTLMVVSLNRGNMLFPYPSVVFFYNRAGASAAVKQGVINRVLDILVEKGYTVFHTVQGTGHKDEVWERAVSNPRVSLKRIGGFYEIRIK